MEQNGKSSSDTSSPPSLSVHLDDSDTVVAGSSVKGHIVIECIDLDELKSLQIQVQGEERVAFRHSSFSASNLFLLLSPPIQFNPKLQEGLYTIAQCVTYL